MTDALKAAIAAIDRRFQSGNSVPVDKATVPAAEWAALLAAADALAAQPAAEPLTAEQFLDVPDVPAEDTGLNTYYSRDVVLECIQAAIDATQPARAGGDATSPDAMVAKAWGRFEVEMHRLDSLKQRFFAYEEEVGFDTYDTAEQAQAAAEESIAQYRAGATDEWDSAVENVCWGVILGRPEEVEVGEPNDDGERAVDYRLAALAAAPQQEAPADFPTRILDLLHDVSDRKGTGTAGPWEDEYGEPLQDDAEAALRWIASRAAAPQPAAAEHVVDANKMVRPDHLVDLNKMFPPDFNALIGWLADEAHAAIRAAYPAVRTESLDRAVQSYFEAMQPTAAEPTTFNAHAHTQNLPSLAAVGHHDLDDAAGRQQASESVVSGAGESGAVAGLDRDDAGVGLPANESRALGGLRPQPHAVAGGLTDQFRGDDVELVRNIGALLDLDAAKALVPHGIGGHARTLLSAAAVRLSAQAEQPAASTVPATDAQNPRFTMDEWQDHARKYKLRFDLAEMPTTNGGAAAPAAVERQPLTDAQIEALAKPFIVNCGGHWNNCAAIEDNGDVEDFARAIERQHGIGSSKEGGAA